MRPTAEAPKDDTRSAVTPPAPPGPDAWRVEVFRRAAMGDPAGSAVSAAMVELGLARPAEARVAKGYLLSPRYTREAVDEIAAHVLADPVVDEVRVLAPHSGGSAGPVHRVLVMPRPGVTDPVAHTVEDLLVRTRRTPASGAPAVATYRVCELRGEYSRAELTTFHATNESMSA